MKLYLLGGAEIDGKQPAIQFGLMQKIIDKEKPRQILHVPYSRTRVPEGEEDVWGEGWFHKNINVSEVEYLSPEVDGDLEKADSPFVFISGGSDRKNLVEKVKGNPLLKSIILGTEIYMGESAGSMFTGSLMRELSEGSGLVSGLGFLKSTIIEPHYHQRGGVELLKREMEEGGVERGIGIDSATVLEFDTENFPDKYEVYGEGEVEIISGVGEV